MIYIYTCMGLIDKKNKKRWRRRWSRRRGRRNDGIGAEQAVYGVMRGGDEEEQNLVRMYIHGYISVEKICTYLYTCKIWYIFIYMYIFFRRGGVEEECDLLNIHIHVNIMFCVNTYLVPIFTFVYIQWTYIPWWCRASRRWGRIRFGTYLCTCKLWCFVWVHTWYIFFTFAYILWTYIPCTVSYVLVLRKKIWLIFVYMYICLVLKTSLLCIYVCVNILWTYLPCIGSWEEGLKNQIRYVFIHVYICFMWRKILYQPAFYVIPIYWETRICIAKHL